MNEAETRAELIDPALAAAGWGVVAESRVRREVQITLGRLEGAGRRARPLIADYVLMHRGRRLAVIEAKARGLGVTEGVGQAKQYAGMLRTRFAYSTNGVGVWRIDMESGEEGHVPGWPAPDDLWTATFANTNAWRDRFAAVSYEEKGGAQPARYYQVNAVEAALQAVADGRDRILLTLATGTGKTFIAFQIAWKLFHARWSLAGRESAGVTGRRPRILFLADRNILADQAYNAFSAFPEDALVRIAPDAIRKKGRVPKNGSVFFTIFQTFMSGGDAEPEDEPYFGDYPPDFFDLIVIDECHRGGARDESNWRSILDYFAPAVLIGLTATPKRRDNVDTYRYFGEPVYSYSLKEGIADGFLTPFKVRQIATTIDDYVWTADDKVLAGSAEEGRRYGEGDFNRIIEIAERERYRVEVFMAAIDQREKTLVFCATQEHAAAVRDLVNQIKTSPDPNYCARVTAADGALGDQHLRAFQDNEKTIPTILTTSQKLSTGVNARNVRNIVLMRPIASMIEFKQIIGRGTRLYEGKDYFTIHDFVKAYEHFSDPEWDGEPVEPAVTEGGGPRTPGDAEGGAAGDPPDKPERPARLVIVLADGKARSIRHIAATTFWGPEGRPLSAQQFIEALFGRLPDLFRSESELRALWCRPDTRRKLMEGLAERGFGPIALADIAKVVDAEDSDLFDVLAYIAFAVAPISRAARVAARRTHILSAYDARLRSFLDFVLGQYVDQGVEELDQEKLPHLLELKYHTVSDAADELGGTAAIRDSFVGFQRGLYAAGPG
ncbi:MAG: DEAD/DEAH box helicase family protein [Pseudomonadota bacterium]|nr:DEAD/DEAH box helicase family protein [Pseudomonadota bacterium]